MNDGAKHRKEVSLLINGKRVKRVVSTQQRLLEFLREDLNLTGAKEVCGEGECGACTILLNGKTVNSCLILSVEADGSEVLTVEGLGLGDKLTALQQAFIDHHAVQCGYCIPGMILSGEYLLKRNPDPDREEVRRALAGNICRCTGYQKIVDAVMAALKD